MTLTGDPHRAGTERGPRPRLGIVGLAVLALALGGCISGSAPATDTEAEPGSSASVEGSNATWSDRLEGQVEYLYAVKTPEPSSGLLWSGECSLFAFEATSTMEELTVGVASPTINTSQPGAGQATFRTAQVNATDWRQPPDENAPAEERELTVKDPKPGEWRIWMLPWHASVNQVFDVTVELEGTGEGPVPAPSLEPLGNCEEDRVHVTAR